MIADRTTNTNSRGIIITSGSSPLSVVSGIGELKVPLSIVDDVVSNRTVKSLNVWTREKIIHIRLGTAIKSMVHVVIQIIHSFQNEIKKFPRANKKVTINSKKKNHHFLFIKFHDLLFNHA